MTFDDGPWNYTSDLLDKLKVRLEDICKVND